MHATIPAHYTDMSGRKIGLGYPINLYIRDEDYSDPAGIMYQLTRSVLSAMSDGTLNDWRVSVPRADGYDTVYAWDGVEVVRTNIRKRREGGADAIRAALLSQNRVADTVSDETYGDTIHPMVETRAAKNGRKVPTRYKVGGTGDAKERRKYARRVLAKAMGFKGIKDWKAAGYPIDVEKITGTVKAHKVDSMLTDAALGQSPNATGGIQVHNMSVVRPTRLPGQYQGHSHNN